MRMLGFSFWAGGSRITDPNISTASFPRPSLAHMVQMRKKFTFCQETLLVWGSPAKPETRTRGWGVIRKQCQKAGMSEELGGLRAGGKARKG